MKIGSLGDVTGSAYLETGVRMHYFDAGQGPAALVLLHGFPQTSWQWRHVIEPLATAGYRVIAPDYRGAGNSSRPRSDPGQPADLRDETKLARGGYTKWEMAEDIHLLLQAYAVLLQESSGKELLADKAINAMANKLDERLDKAVEKTLNKMSTTVECLLTNQKEIQTTTSALSDMAETIKKLTHDMGNNVKAATETSVAQNRVQLTGMVTHL